MKKIITIVCCVLLLHTYTSAQSTYPGFPEKFDTSVDKDNYKEEEVQFGTGVWRLKGVKLVTKKWGIEVTDDGTKGLMFLGNSARLFVAEMQFDLQEGASKVSMLVSSAGNDSSCKWILQASTDGGKKWRKIGKDILTDNKSAKEQVFKVSIKGQVRFRILKLGLGDEKEDSSIKNGRLVIDDFVVYK